MLQHLHAQNLGLWVGLLHAVKGALRRTIEWDWTTLDAADEANKSAGCFQTFSKGKIINITNYGQICKVQSKHGAKTRIPPSS